MYLKQFFVRGLGHASYLLAPDRTREAAVVDPRRDIQVYLDEARQAGLRIHYVLETHTHNDFVSGAQHLAEVTGAEYVASAEAVLRSPYRPIREGDELELGELTIRVLFTPGHTPEHVTYVVIDRARAAAPVLAFTGGDLLVGSVGRPDLLGKELGEQLAPLLYESLHNKILRLEDYVEVWPTHGSGSLCGKNIGSKLSSTIGYERRFNPALQCKTKDEFVRDVLSGNPGIPAYYRHMRPLNQHGPPAWQLPEPRPLSPAEVRHLAGHGALVVDVRASAAYGGGHIPGAMNIGLASDFATWVGWLLSHDVPLVLVLDRPEQWEEAVTDLGRIGYERVAGYLQDGMDAWSEAGLEVAHLPQWSVHELRQRLAGGNIQVLDVRMDSEWNVAHIEGAVHLMLGDLPARLHELDRSRPLAVVCSTGYRSGIATGLLEQQGFTMVANVLGGMTAWSAAGYSLAREGPAQDRELAGMAESHER